ncbi:MAG: HD-GYP domain-containing protein [Desulfococcaceae bacterium]
MRPKMQPAISAIHQFSESLGNAIDAKDPYTERHSMEVAEISRILALSLGLGTETADIIHIAGHLHDIGKIGVPDAIIHKEGALTETETFFIRRHPEIGADILRPVREIASSGICEMVLHHHERYDGNGYPFGIKGESVPMGARIIAVADSLSAMTGSRTYRAAKNFDTAMDEIVRCAGTQFDPAIVTALLANREKVQNTMCSLNSSLMNSRFGFSGLLFRKTGYRKNPIRIPAGNFIQENANLYPTQNMSQACSS